jgi:hypothetical protein
MLQILNVLPNPPYFHATTADCRPHSDDAQVNAMLFLISAIASAGFSPLGQVRLQLRMVWHRYMLMVLFSASCRWAVFSSRESAIHRYD